VYGDQRGFRFGSGAPAQVTDFAAQSSYNGFMARGWESKFVETQIESAETSHQEASQTEDHNPDRMRRRQALLLSRSRVLQQMQLSLNSRHREMLSQALADLEAELAEFN
jgi:hypothetical protein